MRMMLNVMSIQKDYSKFTITIATNAEFYGSGTTDEQAEAFALQIAEKVAARFPGADVATQSMFTSVAFDAATEDDRDEVETFINATWEQVLATA